MHTHPTNNKNFKGNLFPKRKTNFETCHTQHFSKLTNETSKKTEFWNNFSREKAKRKKKKTRENITHQQQKQQISVEISISFPSTQIALHKRKAEIKCLFLIVSLCFLLHFLLLGDFFFAVTILLYGCFPLCLWTCCFWCVWNRRNINFFFAQPTYICVLSTWKFKGHSPIRVWAIFFIEFFLWSLAIEKKC